MPGAMAIAGPVALGFVVSLFVGLTGVGSAALMAQIRYLDYSGILSHAAQL